MKLSRSPLVALATLLLTSILHGAPPPNVVIIFTDDQAYADVGCFGGKGFSTPNLDRMAAEGRRFTNFHVAQPVCTASRTALLTGCYPNRLGLSGALGPRTKVALNRDEVTIADLLKTKGYATAAFGKWHLGDTPDYLPPAQGFDEYFGIPYSGDMWPHHPEAKPGSYPPLPLIEGAKAINPDLQPADQEKLTTQYAEHAVDFIGRNKDRPFFLYVAPNQPHVPLFVSDKFRGKSQKGLYGDVLMEIDWLVGEILGAIKKNGLDENTLVIFSTDNGPWLSYGNHAGSALPLREGKGTNWEGGTRVPCIMRWPGKIPAGTECKDALMTIDVLPTIAKLADAELPARKIDGLNVWPLIAGEPGAKNPHDGYWFYYETNSLQAVSSGDWKLVLPHRYRTMEGQPQGKDGIPGKYRMVEVKEPELYNLASDISEVKNVASENPDTVQRLLAIAESARAELGDALTKRKGSGVREPGRVTDRAAAQQ